MACSFGVHRGIIWGMEEPKKTRITIREDLPTAISSSLNGANLDAIGFNVPFLAMRSPRLAIEVMKLFAVANNVSKDDPKAPEEDIAMYAEELAKILAADKSGEDDS